MLNAGIYEKTNPGNFPIGPTQAMVLQKSNGDLQKSRRLAFTFTFHFNVIKQLQFFVSVNTSFYGP
jgi:hypothetical protein